MYICITNTKATSLETRTTTLGSDNAPKINFWWIYHWSGSTRAQDSLAHILVKLLTNIYNISLEYFTNYFMFKRSLSNTNFKIRDITESQIYLIISKKI